MTATEARTELVDKALSRISVRRPYFGFDALEQLGSGIVAGNVPAADPVAPEYGPMDAGQVSRHLAILGSCAAALSRDDDDRHHYLAVGAHFSRMASAPIAPPSDELRAEAFASWVDRRTARAVVKLATAPSDGRAGQGLYMLDVTYAVLTPKVFDRFHPAVAADVGTDGSPNTLTSGTVEEIDGGVRMDCGPIPVSACAGHFPNYPAAPVAIVMSQLARTAGLALASHLSTLTEGGPGKRADRGCLRSYCVEEAHVTASKLGHAGQRLVLEAHYDRPVHGGHLVNGVATADGDVIGELAVTLCNPASKMLPGAVAA